MSSSSSSLRPVDRRSILPSPGLWGSCLLQRVFQIALSQSTRSASRWLFFTTRAKGIGRPSPHPVHRELLIKKANFALARARSPFRLFKTTGGRDLSILRVQLATWFALPLQPFFFLLSLSRFLGVFETPLRRCELPSTPTGRCRQRWALLRLLLTYSCLA